MIFITWLVFGLGLLFAASLPEEEESFQYPARAKTPCISTGAIAEAIVSSGTSAVTASLLGYATFLGSECTHFDGCTEAGTVLSYLKIGLAVWCSGKLAQSLLGCCTISEPRIIRRIMILLATVFCSAMSMITLETADLRVEVGFTVIWLGLLILEVYDLRHVLSGDAHFWLNRSEPPPSSRMLTSLQYV